MKKNIHTVSKKKATLLLGLAIITLGSTFVCANIIMSKRNQVANVTNVLGAASNEFYDMKIIGYQTSPQKIVGGTDVTKVSVQLSVTNKTSEAFQISPGLQLHLTSTTGGIYPVTARYLTPGVVLGGQLAASNEMLLNVDFDLPAAEQPSSIAFQLDLSKPTVTAKL